MSKKIKPNIIVFGASGHAKVIIDIIELEDKYHIVGLIDSYKPKGQSIFGYTILGTEKELPSLAVAYDFIYGIIAIGDNWVRQKIYNKIKQIIPKFKFITAIHPSAIIGKNVQIGEGTVIMPGVLINANAKIGDFCIVNTKASVGHDCILENYSSISSGVTLGGSVVLNFMSAISIGATVIQNIEVGECSVVGAGAVVTKNIDAYVVAYGVPARIIRKREGEDKYLYKAKDTLKLTSTINRDSLQVILEKNKWNKVIGLADNYDFYHTFEYHMAAKRDNEMPILLKYTQDNVVIILPLLIRKIRQTKYSDITCVYGYPGPIFKGVKSTFDNTLFANTLLNFFKENNIVSVFSRLNPYISNQKLILKNMGEIVEQGKVVNIDITQEVQIQRQNYQKRLKNHVNKVRKNCDVFEATTAQDINDFVEIYHENMGRINAKKYYYFGRAYFKSLVNSTSFKTLILLAKEKETNKTIAGSMFVCTKNIVQYHLSGCRSDYLHLMPTKLLIDEMRLRATQMGYKYFNLGGGLGGRDDDSLFRFKSSFSKQHKTFKLWKLIVDQEAYTLLVNKYSKDADSDFFPKYRCLNN